MLGDVPAKHSPKCSKNLRLVVTDIPSQGSLCGMRVLQKIRQSVNSVVTQKCFKIDKSKIRGDYEDYLPGLKSIIVFFFGNNGPIPLETNANIIFSVINNAIIEI